MPTTYRPSFHFSPPQGWMNDPNGLVYFNGLWHLFYQHVPHQVRWEPALYWGHAVSRDLAHWEHWPIALSPDELGGIFSGSAVVNIGADGTELVACFTHCNERNQQSQSLAFSGDEGRTWRKYEGNPVLASDRIDFRDPRIFRFEDQWTMVVSGGHEAHFYNSPNLTDWTLLSTVPTPREGWIWECPDLFEVDGQWVLIASFVAPGNPVLEGSRAQGWIGEFDGVHFTPRSKPQALSFGPDDYATVSWNNAPHGRRIIIGWMGHLAYAGQIPTESENWRGAMTLPRELSIRNGALQQNPPRELETLRGDAVFFDENSIDFRGEAFEIEAAIDIANLQQSEVGFHVRAGSNEATTVLYSKDTSELSIDRTQSGQSDFHADFAHVFRAPLEVEDDVLKLRIFVDRCSIEVFAQDGALYGAALIFPSQGSDGIEFVGQGARVKGTIYNCS